MNWVFRSICSIVIILLNSCQSGGTGDAEKTNSIDPAEFITKFEQSKGTETSTYTETLSYYERLASAYPTIRLDSVGQTDSGLPLHLVTFSQRTDFSWENRTSDDIVLFINNGIHPGESDGIDASQLMFRKLVQDSLEIPENLIVAAIPIYNVGGSLQRNSTTRTNQNGPESYGFRGNARNYDLNRDFIKADTRNAQSFARLIQHIQPDFFIDTHVSNGADYQYTLTHLFSQHNKLGWSLGNYQYQVLRPGLENELQKREWDITPYVNVFNTPPEKGFVQFMDYPRYSTGFTALWNIPGLMIETHMLKPYRPRVYGTLAIFEATIVVLKKEGKHVRLERTKNLETLYTLTDYPIQWQVDSTSHRTLDFKGYESAFVTSKITGQKRLQYNSNQSFTEATPYYDRFSPKKQVAIPEAYILPQGWWTVKERLDQNRITYTTLEKDTILNVETYRIDSYTTSPEAYEGHYPHSETIIAATIATVQFRKGDLWIPTQQPGIRYLLETLEPEATDSFFNWNFFDTILQQKEHFSPYVWEDKALALLNTQPELKKEFEQKKKEDQAFAKNGYAQLDWLHKRSENYEPAHLQYPVYRVLRK